MSTLFPDFIPSTLFPDLAPSVARREFLPDLVYGSVAEAWAQVVTHFLPPPATVADLTCRHGVMWANCAAGYRVLRFDVDPRVHPHALADCRWPALRRESVDALVVDVPWSLDPGKGRGYAAEAYGSRFTSVNQVLDLFRGANWWSCVRPSGWCFVRIQNAHHGQRPVMLAQRCVPRVEAGDAWELWDEVVHACGGRGAQAGMIDPPKCRHVTARFQVYRRSE